jgi:hypothetical protein
MRNTDLHIIQQLKQQPKQSAKKAPQSITSAGAGFLKEVTGDDNSTIAGLLKIQNVIADTAGIVSKLTSATNALEEANKSLQDQFGLNIEDSTRMGASLDQLSKELGVGGGKLRAYAISLKSLVGGYAGAFIQATQQAKELQKKLAPMLKTQSIIQNQLKLSGDIANNIISYSATVGKSSDDMLANYVKLTEQITEQTGYQVSAKEVIEDIGGLSEDLLLQYGKMPNKLALATIKAKALGVTMKQLNSIGNNLLNIESSIGQELEYQLLSGRRLIGDEKASAKLQGQSLTNAYRQATLQGKSEDQAEILNQILKQEGTTLKNNLFARKQMAEMLQMDEAALAKSIMKQDTLNELQAKGILNFDAKSILDSKLTDEEKKSYLDKLKSVSDTRTTDEKMADDIESIVTDGIKLLTPEKAAAAAAARSERLRAKGIEVPEAAAGSFGSGDVLPIGRTITGAQGILKGVDIGAAFVKSLASTTLKTPWEIHTTGDVSIASSQMKGAGDLYMGPGGGRAVIGPEGSFALSNNDAILASPTAGQGADMSGFAAAIVNAIKQQTDALTSNSGINAPIWS